MRDWPWVDNSRFYTAVGQPDRANTYWRLISETMRREKGVFRLCETEMNPTYECVNYLMEADTEGALDIIEFSFRVIDRSIRALHPIQRSEEANITQNPDEAIEELNQRFREHGLGYQYSGGLIVRVDSQFLHAEVIQPALELLAADGFGGPNDEFVKAFEHYRHRRYKEAVAEALKAFESTMKAICELRNWHYQPGATAKPLLDLLFKKGLIPAELESHFGSFRSAMESGLPTLRNRTSGHGQGPEPKPLPAPFAAYALHLAATNIVFLIGAHNVT